LQRSDFQIGAVFVALPARNEQPFQVTVESLLADQFVSGGEGGTLAE
jgi:hypothetical protein